MKTASECTAMKVQGGYLSVDSFSGRSGDKRTREWHSVGQEAGLWRALISWPLLTEVRERNSFTPSERQQVGQRVMGVKGRGRRKKGREKDRKVVRAFTVQPSERLCLSQPPQLLWPSYRAIMEMFLWSRVLHFFFSSPQRSLKRSLHPSLLASARTWLCLPLHLLPFLHSMKKGLPWWMWSEWSDWTVKVKLQRDHTSARLEKNKINFFLWSLKEFF